MWKSEKDLSGVTDIDWARLAAFIDGEGHIGIVRKGIKKTGPRAGKRGADYIRITIANTDPRLIIWLQLRFGGGRTYRNISREINHRWKGVFHWDTASAHAARLLEGCLKYFIIKRDQAEIALAFQATMKRRGVKGTPESILNDREALKQKIRLLTARGPQLNEATG